MAFLTNFNIDDTRYKRALKEYVKTTGDKSIYIDRNAYNGLGNKMLNHNALRTNDTSVSNINTFWRIFDNTPKCCFVCGKELEKNIDTVCSKECRDYYTVREN